MRNADLTSRKPIHAISLLICFMLLITGCTRILSPGNVQETQSTQSISAISADHTISQIQGAEHRSPFESLTVDNVRGIVTAIRADGFYMQSILPDDDPATSEGIYVYQGLVPAVRPGDEVLVSAMVEEIAAEVDNTNNLTITQLSYPKIEILSRGNPLPSPTVIGQGGRLPPTEVISPNEQNSLPAERTFDPLISGLDFFESLEGMLVQVNNAVVVGATNRYKEIVILPDDGVWAGVRTPRGGIVVQEDDFNPERIILDDGLRDLPFVQVGDYAVKPIIGVMDYTFGNYKLQPIDEVVFASGGLQPSDPLAPVEPGQVRVASYNVDVLSALDTARIATLADHIVTWMGSPEIIGLQEVADNDGVDGLLAVSADQSYQSIIEAITKIGGPPYDYVDIDPLPDQDGGVPGANIRVGFLYRLDRGLSLAEGPHGDSHTAVRVLVQDGIPTLSLNPGRIDPTHPAFTNSRKPLVATFLINGQPLIVINTHFNAKGADTGLFGAVQPPVLHSEAQRLGQARVVHEFVVSILAIEPRSQVIVLGDLNDYHFSAPVQILKGELLHNLIETLPVEERYTYIYDGNSQVLDHILVSDSLKSRLNSLDILHLNSEFDYRRQFSDHDPVVATFDLE
jgi:uncharacterized protein